ncbi:protein of unknown function [Bizionia echini]|uniref:Thioredoxin domain-containing protein n=1 Tax=Bizionia echini TaxID=649333 RepID=A0A1I5C6B8_9FLAO|nr:TlpA disulfide reductase family protein [Bizionia echini]SFN82477.1 protein of unknown function [Bizionia echini]
MKRVIPLLLLTLILFQSCLQETKSPVKTNKATVLKGCVYGRDSDTLILVKAHQDTRFDTIASIPILDWEFEFTFNPEEVELYHLVFKDELNEGAWRPIEFYADQDTIQFVLHSATDFFENEIKGGQINTLFKDYQENINRPYGLKLEGIYKIFDSIPYSSMYSETYQEVLEKLNTAETPEERETHFNTMEALKKQGLDKNELGRKIDAEVATVQDTYWTEKYTFINKNPSIVSYSLLIEDLQSLSYNPAPKEKLIFALNNLNEAFPNHSYTELSQNLWIGYTEMTPGGQYINFSAPDMDAVYHELKPFVKKNDVLLLDLWATWCGPCIVRSRLMKPVYEKYKNKGFDIVGVAGEKKNLEAYKKFMNAEQWPWKNLIELDNENKIWEKYNIMNGGGGMFLISKSGEILAVDPTAEEVEAILEKQLLNNDVKI